MFNKRLLLASLIILSLILSACGGFGAPKTVKVVVSLPLSFGYTQDMLNSAQLALDKANGKAGDVNVELLVLNQSIPNGDDVSVELEKKNAEQAASDPSVVAYLGPSSSGTVKVSLPILNKASLVQISGSATWPGLTKPGYGPGEPGMYYPSGVQTFFRTVPSDEVQGKAAANWAARLGFKSVYIVNGTGAYEQGVAGIFENTATDIGIQILGHDTYSSDGQVAPDELQAIITRVTNAQPDLIYLGGNTGYNGEVVGLALRQANATLPIMGPDGLVVDDFIKTLGSDLANNIYGTTGALPADQIDTPAATDFLSSYQAAYGKAPGAYDAPFYEAMNVLLYAIGNAKEPTRKGVLEAMQNLGDYTGVFGTWHFDEQGDISVSNLSGMQVQNGTWVFVEALK